MRPIRATVRRQLDTALASSGPVSSLAFASSCTTSRRAGIGLPGARAARACWAPPLPWLLSLFSALYGHAVLLGAASACLAPSSRFRSLGCSFRAGTNITQGGCRL